MAVESPHLRVLLLSGTRARRKPALGQSVSDLADPTGKLFFNILLDRRRRGTCRFRRKAEGGPAGAIRVMNAPKPVDFRMGAETLAALARESMR